MLTYWLVTSQIQLRTVGGFCLRLTVSEDPRRLCDFHGQQRLGVSTRDGQWVRGLGSRDGTRALPISLPMRLLRSQK
jgi:hypothetical protein